jgi:hypothetical protein
VRRVTLPHNEGECRYHLDHKCKEFLTDTHRAKAAKAKKQHLQQNLGYSYHPPKPSGKKRRVTKRKIAPMPALALLRLDEIRERESRVLGKPNQAEECLKSA